MTTKVQPTREEWDKFRLALSTQYGRATLRVDGFDVVAEVQRYKGLRFCIVVYVNGAWSGERLDKDTEERRKFWRARPLGLFTPKMLREHEKKFGKRATRELRTKYTKSIWLPNWPSADAFRRHLVKNTDSIELVGTGYTP